MLELWLETKRPVKMDTGHLNPIRLIRQIRQIHSIRNILRDVTVDTEVAHPAFRGSEGLVLSGLLTLMVNNL